MTERSFYRLMNLAGATICAAAMGFALYLQHVEHLEPCSMCIFQRVAMIAAGVFFLLAAIVGAQAARLKLVLGLLPILAALAGLAIAARHVWLQSLPADQVPACGPALDYLLDIMPLWEVVHSILRGDGNCAVIDWTLLGLSLPAWTAIGFFLLVDWALMCMMLPRVFSRAGLLKPAHGSSNPIITS